MMCMRVLTDGLLACTLGSFCSFLQNMDGLHWADVVSYAQDIVDSRCTSCGNVAVLTGGKLAFDWVASPCAGRLAYANFK